MTVPSAHCPRAAIRSGAATRGRGPRPRRRGGAGGCPRRARLRHRHGHHGPGMIAARTFPRAGARSRKC